MIGQNGCLSLFSPAPRAAARCHWPSHLPGVAAEGALAAPRRFVSVRSAAPCWHLQGPAGEASPASPRRCGDTDTIFKFNYLPPG